MKILRRAVALPGVVTYSTVMGNGVDANGFTTLTLRPTVAKRYYVGTGGLDTNTGLSHAQRFLTYAKARSLITSGAGDQIVIAEGTTLSEALSWFSDFTGFSAQYPTVVSSYDPADPTNEAKIGMGHQRSARPKFTSNTNQVTNSVVTNLALKGIEFDSGNLNEQKFQMVGATSNMLIENCIFRYNSISYDFSTYGPQQNFIFRNNSVYGGWGTASGADGGGLYLSGNYSAVVEDNVFYHSGWKVGATRDDAYTIGGPTAFRHGIYAQTTSEVINRRNLYMDTSSEATTMRGNHQTYENVAIRCPAGFNIGGGTGYDANRPNGITIQASYNLAMEGIDRNTANPLGWGMGCENGIPGSKAHHNLFFSNSGTNTYTLSNNADYNQPSYMAFEDNVAYGWTPSNAGLSHYATGGAFPAQCFTTFDRNKWDDVASGTNVKSISSMFPNPYTPAQLYTAAGVTDYATLVNLAINAPEQHYQRTLRSLAFAGYGIS